MKVAAILEAGGSAKAAAFKLQQELLDVGSEDAVDVDLVKPNSILIRKALNKIDDDAINTDIALKLDDAVLRVPVELLLVYSKTFAKWGLYHVQADRFTTDAAEMLEILVKWEEDGGRMNESIEMSASTKLNRFAKELIAHGFEAEVKNKSKVGIVNRSKLCIQVKGYGIKDEFKLYRPLWKWEADRGELVDVKHERKFASIKELVAKLKEFYPKLPNCLTYTPPPIKESSDIVPIRARVLKLQQDLIEICDDVSPFIVHDVPLADTSARASFRRYVFQLTIAPGAPRGFADKERHFVVFIDEEYDGLVCTTLLKSTTDEEPTLTTRAIETQQGLRRVFDSDESASGRQDSMDELIAWLT